MAEPDEQALRLEAERALRERRFPEAAALLSQLAEMAPENMGYHVHLSWVLEALGRPDDAIAHYRRLLAQHPQLAPAHFNLALLLKRNHQYRDALAAYERAIELGIDNAHQVYSNLGVLYSEMRRPEDAQRMFRQALAVDDRYLPALFNLAGSLEETGQREEAIGLYERILAIEPRHREALARLAYARKVTPADSELVERLERAAAEAEGEVPGQEALFFALGKARDDLGEYDAAFAAYRRANALGRKRNPPYDRAAMERFVDDLMGVFSADWISRRQTDVVRSPIFICGMPRSGSTLVEQILAAHPAVQAGGELEFLPWLLAKHLMPYPQRALDASREDLSEIAGAYADLIAGLFPGAAQVTDKRPDNFLHIGFIAAAFPRARIVHTRRNPVDNCLSVWFQQLGGNLAWATDLEDTGHFYRQYRRLMDHWVNALGSRLYTVDYDRLVAEPREVIAGLLGYLGLEWDDRCLDFRNAAAPVQTASVWQVREALHTGASGRWKNYEGFLDGLKRELGVGGDADRP